MSYDISIYRTIGGIPMLNWLGSPEYSNPTYNLRPMFVACMDWDYNQSDFYYCDFVLERVERGLKELKTNRKAYERYNPEKGWGDIDTAIMALDSLREYLCELAEEFSLEHLFMHW